MRFLKMVALKVTIVAYTLFWWCGISLPETARLKVVYSAFDATYLPLWVAEEKGLFKSEGLDVEIIYVEGGSTAAQALQSKSIDVAVIGGGPIEANLSGGDLIYIAAHVPVPIFAMFALKEIKGAEDLKGKTVGTTAAASVTEYATILTLKRFALAPYKDVKILHTGGMDKTFAALSQGLIQAGIFAGPPVISARKSGFKEIVNLASLRIPFVHEGVSVRRAFMQEQRETLKKFMRGFVLGIRLSKAEKSLSYRTIEKYLKIKDRQVIEGAYDEIVPYFAPEPFVPRAAIQNMLSLIADRVPQAKTAVPERFYDNGILDDLKNEGFFK